MTTTMRVNIRYTAGGSRLIKRFQWDVHPPFDARVWQQTNEDFAIQQARQKLIELIDDFETISEELEA